MVKGWDKVRIREVSRGWVRGGVDIRVIRSRSKGTDFISHKLGVDIVWRECVIGGGEKLIDFLCFVSPIVWEKSISSECMKKGIPVLFGPVGHIVFYVLVVRWDAKGQ